MSYVMPELEALFTVDTIRQHYHGQRLAPNPERLALLNFLEKIQKHLQARQDSHDAESDAYARSVMVGAYLYCLERIAAEYHLSDPQFKEGYLYNAGSKLYSLLQNKLNISSENTISDTDALVHVSHFYDYFNAHKNDFMEAHQIPAQDEQIKNVLKGVFARNRTDVKDLLKSIPAESVLDNSMHVMQEEYLALTKADNKERRFFTKVVKAMSEALPAREQDQHEKHFLSRRQRIKMGFLLYLMQEIWDSYYLRSPKGNSALYDLSRKAMNIEKMADIDEYTRVACLSAFETFLLDSKSIGKLEQEMGKVYLDPKIRIMRKQLDGYIEQLQPSVSSNSISSFAIGCATVGAIIASAPGYGTGYVLGYTLSQIDEMVDVKLQMTKVTDFSMTVIFGKAGGYLGYFAANMLVDATLERGFAKVFEALGMLMGAATGGLIGLVIYDLSYKTLLSLCKLHQELHHKLSPHLAKDLDSDYVKSLLALPEDIFPNDKKEKVKQVADQGLFKASRHTGQYQLLQSSDEEQSLLRTSRNYFQ